MDGMTLQFYSKLFPCNSTAWLFFLFLLYTVGHKNVALYFRLYLCQLFSDFQNSFTGRLCRQFAIMWLLYIPSHLKLSNHTALDKKSNISLVLFSPGSAETDIEW